MLRVRTLKMLVEVEEEDVPLVDLPRLELCECDLLNLGSKA